MLMQQREIPAMEADQRRAHRIWNLVAGVILGLAAVLSLPLIFGNLGGDQGVVNWYTIFIGCFVSGSLVWWLLIGRSRSLETVRGISAGVLSTIIAYPLVFVLGEMVFGELPALAQTDSLIGRVSASLQASVLAIVLGGGFTVLLGAIVGGLLVYVQRRLMDEMQEQVVPVIADKADAVQDFAHRRPWISFGLGVVVVVAAVILLVGSWVWFAPLRTGVLTSSPEPIQDYTAAVSAIDAILAVESVKELNPACGTKLLTHGDKTERAVVFVHGFTNCPEQFVTLGEQFFDQGYNVFIPRMPHHGLADRLTTDPARLTAEELVRFGDNTVDISQGLGEEITYVGLSGGGNVAAWVAQHRPDVDHAVLIAPMLGVLMLPDYVVKPVINAALTLPNLSIWWDPATRENVPGPDYTYPRFASKAIGQLLRLGYEVQQVARNLAPATDSILTISNEADPAVNNDVLEKLVDKWRKNGNAVVTYQFPDDLRLPHDLIDPNQPEQQVELVYPILFDLIDGDS
jgi:esterase/lipase